MTVGLRGGDCAGDSRGEVAGQWRVPLCRLFHSEATAQWREYPYAASMASTASESMSTAPRTDGLCVPVT